LRGRSIKNNKKWWRKELCPDEFHMISTALWNLKKMAGQSLASSSSLPDLSLPLKYIPDNLMPKSFTR
jgi:hypothetical protein